MKYTLSCVRETRIAPIWDWEDEDLGKWLLKYCHQLKAKKFKIEIIAEKYPVIELNTAEDFNRMLATVGSFIVGNPAYYDYDDEIANAVGEIPTIEIYDDYRE